MTKLTTSREVRLASRPKGIPTAANFTLAESALTPLQAQQVLVRNLFMSVDPYMRGRMNEGKSYVPPFAIGQALEGGAIGEVVESRANEFKSGEEVFRELNIYFTPEDQYPQTLERSEHDEHGDQPLSRTLFNFLIRQPFGKIEDNIDGVEKLRGSKRVHQLQRRFPCALFVEQPELYTGKDPRSNDCRRRDDALDGCKGHGVHSEQSITSEMFSSSPSRPLSDVEFAPDSLRIGTSHDRSQSGLCRDGESLVREMTSEQHGERTRPRSPPEQTGELPRLSHPVILARPAHEVAPKRKPCLSRVWRPGAATGGKRWAGCVSRSKRIMRMPT